MGFTAIIMSLNQQVLGSRPSGVTNLIRTLSKLKTNQQGSFKQYSLNCRSTISTICSSPLLPIVPPKSSIYRTQLEHPSHWIESSFVALYRADIGWWLTLTRYVFESYLPSSSLKGAFFSRSNLRILSFSSAEELIIKQKSFL